MAFASRTQQVTDPDPQQQDESNLDAKPMSGVAGCQHGQMTNGAWRHGGERSGAPGVGRGRELWRCWRARRCLNMVMLYSADVQPRRTLEPNSVFSFETSKRAKSD